MQIMFSYSLSSYNMSGQPSFSVHEGIPHLTQEFRPTEIAEAPEEVDHGMEQRRHTEGGAPVQNMVFPESGGVSGDLGVVPNSIKRRPYEQPESLLHMISKLLKKITPKQHRNVARTILGTKLDAQLSLVGNARDLLRIACRFNVKELRMATEEFKDQLGTDTTDGLFNFFRGILWDMRPVVIKTIRSERENVGTSRLLNELESILCVQHRNVLKLVGFCGDGNRLMLVYDYMANGNLFDVLLHPAKKKLLDWPTRLKIILGVIAAIAYIHHGLDECIAHRDIKPSHILLDEDFNPRISEFGIATPLKELTGGKRTMPGTFDYMAPEYFRNGNLTEKVDMYSFGIVVLEIISGRRRMEDPANEDDFDLLDLAFRLQQEDQLVELADAVLLDGRGYDAGGIINTIMIALRCIEDDPNARPSAYVVLDMLSHLQEDEEQSNVRS